MDTRPKGGHDNNARAGMTKKRSSGVWIARSLHAPDIDPHSPRLNEAVEHHLSASLVKIDRQLVTVHFRHGARPEFEVEHALALAEF